MIRNKEQQKLFMEFKNIDAPKGKPSDIDMFYVMPGGFLVLGEIKNDIGKFETKQRWLYEGLINHHRGDGCVLYILHDKAVEKKDKEVDVADCFVIEYYWHGRWLKPTRLITVNDAFRMLERRCR